MEWFWHDPERDEPTRWWTIDPQTGQSDGDIALDPGQRHCLSESALDAVASVADAIATEFTTDGFTNEEASALLSGRVVPASFRGSARVAAELASSVDDLWALAESCYIRALGRLPNKIERKWLHDFALAMLRARGRGMID